jgi:hypothetical protein
MRLPEAVPAPDRVPGGHARDRAGVAGARRRTDTGSRGAQVVESKPRIGEVLGVNVPLIVAGSLAILAAAVHGVFGEVLVVRKLSPGMLPSSRFGVRG